MHNQIVKNRILSLKVAMLLFPVLALFLLGFSIWLFTLLENPHANPAAETPVIITAVAMLVISAFFFLLWLFVLPKIIKKAEQSLLEYEKMKEVYEQHKERN